MRTPDTLLPACPSGKPPSPVSAARPALGPEPGTGQPVGLSLTRRTQGGHTVAALTGELDVACARTLREQLLSLLRPHSARLVIDLSEVSYCDASGLAVLVGTGRRAELLGGMLRLAAPRPTVDSALRAVGLHRRFDIFPSVSAAVAPKPAAGGTASATGMPAVLRRPTVKVALTVAADAALLRRAAGASDLRAAVAALLSYPDAWRDADPDCRFAPALQVLARAYARTGNARTDNARLAEAAGLLLSVLAEHALTYSPPVAATASRLRRLLDAG
ncbi:MAG: STAS domain-containing protein [Trebonia sp.]